MLPKKLVALTHCIRASLLKGEWDEAGRLLFERQAVIEELGNSGLPLSDEEKLSIREADEAVKEAVYERRQVLRNKMRKVGTVRKLRSTYHVG